MQHITLGRKGTPMDLTIWHARCEAALERRVKFGEVLSRVELRALGFTAAAGDDPKNPSEVR